MSFLDEMFGTGNKYKLSDEFIQFLGERFQSEFDGWTQLRLDAEKARKEEEANKPLDLEAMAEAARKEVAKHIETCFSKHLYEFKYPVKTVPLKGGFFGKLTTDNSVSVTLPKDANGHNVGVVGRHDTNYTISLQLDKFVTKEEFFSLFNQFTIFGYTFFYKRK